MNKQGYVIARNRARDTFFTASSAYDRPSWIPLAEATVYATPDLAQRAFTKLAKNGAYECRILSVTEAFEFQLPDQPAETDDQKEIDILPDGEGGTKMVAADQTGDEVVDDTQADETGGDDVNKLVDDKLGLDNPDDMPPEEGELGSVMSPEGKDLAQRLPAGRRGMSESEVMPAKPPLDAPSSENKNTVHDVAKPELIKYQDPAQNQPDKIASVDSDHEEKCKVPAEVLSDLKQCIDQYKKEGDARDTFDDTRAAFCKTVASAFDQLLQDLELGTVLGVKQAQIHMTSYMNPITANLPPSVTKFIMMGGRKPTLKNLFDDKRQARKAQESARSVNEGTNYMGDRTQQTYSSWKRACQVAYPGCTYTGDKDIGTATLNGKDVGEWDGVEGCVYKKTSASQKTNAQ